MRDIEFRGRPLKNIGFKWVYGYVIKNKKNKTYIISSDPAVGRVEVDPDSVGEFTGLCDDSGVPIFEGDFIVLDVEKSGSPFKGEVKYSEKDASFCWKSSNGECIPLGSLKILPGFRVVID